MFPSFLLNNRSGVFISTDNLLRVWFPSLYTSSETVHWISVQFSSVRSLDRLNRREDLRASATEILSQSVLRELPSSAVSAWAGTSGLHVVCPAFPMGSEALLTLRGALKDVFLQSLLRRVACSNHARFRLWTVSCQERFP